MSVEKLYREIKKGTIRPEQLNDQGRAELRRYVEEKQRQSVRTAPAKRPASTASPTPRSVVRLPDTGPPLEDVLQKRGLTTAPRFSMPSNELPAENTFRKIREGAAGPFPEPTTGQRIASVARSVGQALSDFPAEFTDSATFGLSNLVGRKLGVETKEEQEERNRRVGGKIGEYAGYVMPGAAIERGIAAAARPLIQNVPKAGRLAITGSAAGATEAALQEGGDVAFRGETFDPLNVAIGAGAGGVIGAALPAVGAGYRAVRDRAAFRKAAQEFLNRIETTPMDVTPPQTRTAVRADAPGTSARQRADTAAANYRRGEQISADYEEAVNAEYRQLKESMANRGGVQQGGVIRDEATGEVTGRYGRISNNPRWYQDFYTEHGRAPTDKDLRELARQHVNEGFNEEIFRAPPWRPRQMEAIDEELASLREVIDNTPSGSARDSMLDMERSLIDERSRIKRQMPEGSQALRRSPSVQSMRSGGDVQQSSQFTPDGRALLPRGDGSTSEVVRRSDIVKELSRALDIPIRVGKYRHRAHGIFKVKPEVVRTQLANDIPTISHEVGHALDKRFGLADGRFDDELMFLGRHTSGPGYSADQIRQEGVAEFMRRVLTEPDEIMDVAPNFFRHYESTVPADVRAVISRAGEQIRSYINQPLLLKSVSQMSDGNRSLWDRAREALTDRPFEKLYTKFVEDMQPVRTALKQLDNPKKAARIFRDFRLLRGIAGKAQAFLRRGVYHPQLGKVGKSFEETIRPVMKNLEEFKSYLLEKRAVELAERDIMTSSDLTPAERQLLIDDLEERFPQFKKVQEELKTYQDHLLRDLVDAGVLDPDDVAKFKELNKEYVPFYRDMNAEKKTGSSSGPGVANASNPIRRIKGSDRPILNPLQSIIRNTYLYTMIAERNRVMKSLVDAAVAKDGLGGLVERIPTPMQGTKFTLNELSSVLEKQGVDIDNLDLDAVISLFRPVNQVPGKDNIIAIYRGGKREFYELDPDLYNAVTAADRDQMGVILRALNFPVRMLRSGVVNTLEFWLKNMWRDQFAAMINSRNGYIPYIDMVRGMAHVLRKTETFDKFLTSGGAQAFRQSLDQNYLQQDLRRILAQSFKDKAMNVLKHPIQAMQALSELSEMGTRVGEYSKGVARGKTSREAAFDARDLIDFGRAGSVGRSINKVSAFWNAQVQGLDRAIRTFTDPKTAPKAFAKATAGITAPTAALYELNKNDPRYQELPQWDKDLFWHFWIGDTHFRLPIPFEIGVMFKVIPERILSMTGGEEEPLRGLGDTLKDTLPVPTNIPDMIGMITALSPIAQAWANQNFTGAPIVPRREQDMEPADQAGPYTSQTARAVAKAAASLGAEDSVFGSPRKVDHIIGGYAGSLGKYATQAVDAGLEATGAAETVPRPARGVEQAPVFKAFLGRTISGSTESLDRFYDRLDQLTRQSNSAKKRGRQFSEAGELLRFRSTQRQIGDLTARRRAIEEDRAMTPQQKRREIDMINLNITNLARRALGKDPLRMGDLQSME